MLFSAMACIACVAAEEDLAGWVNPFVGTAGTANCHPNACYPHGMMQAGPTSGTGAWRYCGGYQFEDRELYGFVQDAISGTGCPDLGDIRIQPFAAKNLSRANKYVKSVTLNGRPLAWRAASGVPILRHADIMRGGELVFEMCAHPQRK